MELPRMTGPGAGAEKYDLLTAMAVSGLADGGVRQATMLRLIALITARYNWAADELSMGQREMAQLWSVDERTAKRETKRLIEAGLIEIKRPGVRGRVAAYRLRIDEIYRQTEAGWRCVGPDYQTRMRGRGAGDQPVPQALPASKVVHVDFSARPTPQANPGDDPWTKTMEVLSRQDGSLFQAWFAHLTLAAPARDDLLQIRAPSRFVATYVATRLMAKLEAAVQHAYGRAMRCAILAPDR